MRQKNKWLMGILLGFLMAVGLLAGINRTVYAEGGVFSGSGSNITISGGDGGSLSH
jgi:fructose-specific phosphotransferase system IIC component